MTKYFLSRLGWGAVIVLCILVLNFLIIHAVPGDPLQAMLGDFPVPVEYAAKIRAEFGLDLPIWTQLVLYLKNLFAGQLGFSFSNHAPVLQLMLTRLGPTLLLVLPALVVASLVGVVLGVAAAPRAGSAGDSALTAVSLFGYSVPIFWLGQLLVIVFAIRLGWLPAAGMYSTRDEFTGFAAALDIFRHLVLPGFSVTIFYIAVVARVARASVLEALNCDYVLTARAKGLSRRYVLWRHILPNAMLPVVTVIGYNFGYALTGAILVETVFGWPGLGSLFITSITNRDYPVLQGIFLLVSVSVVLTNLVTDFVYAWLDPRVRRGYLK
ncbi:Dipeptide transport system permease protein DppB [Paraburkholderia humisilvae]|uniref:Dipeptide transport system permease protein DppB n=2 Tax=Paraburkholderia humisilvae TaxID=627669 RepID=A0A6J5F7W1_9BURK|nr:Dipeptide transport system permease protein DppB [Paraburkholderia humisilvae]